MNGTGPDGSKSSVVITRTRQQTQLLETLNSSMSLTATRRLFFRPWKTAEMAQNYRMTDLALVQNIAVSVTSRNLDTAIYEVDLQTKNKRWFGDQKLGQIQC